MSFTFPGTCTVCAALCQRKTSRRTLLSEPSLHKACLRWNAKKEGEDGLPAAATSVSEVTASSEDGSLARVVATNSDDEMEEVNDTDALDAPGTPGDAGTKASDAKVVNELVKLID